MKKLLLTLTLSVSLLITGCSFQKAEETKIPAEKITTQNQITWEQNLTETTEETKSTSEYSISNWVLFFNLSKIYWMNEANITNACENNQKVKKAWTILAENESYLLFTAWERVCDADGEDASYVLNKKDNSYKKIELWDHLYSFNHSSWDVLYIDEYTWWIVWWNGSIGEKNKYENYECPECDLKKIWQLEINLNNLNRYKK